MRLFRSEVTESQDDRLQGEVIVLPKVTHSLISLFLLVWLCLAIAFLTQANYARKETVMGWLEPNLGEAKIFARQAGKVANLLVREGDFVTKSQPLLVINGDITLQDGRHLEDILLAEYSSQKATLQQRLAGLEQLAAERRAAIERDIDGALIRRTWFDEQLATLQQRIDIFESQRSRQRLLNEKGLVSDLELEFLQGQALELHNEFQMISANRVALDSEMERKSAQLRMLPQEAEEQLANVRLRLSDLSQSIARLRGDRAYTVIAPASGRISSLQVRENQWASPEKPLMSIVPDDARLFANLLVPVRASGFVQPGQQLNIRYDAFPHQKFGVHSGRVIQVPRSTVLPHELNSLPIDIREPVYRVKASIASQFVDAYEQQHLLRTGMTLSADVSLENRSVIEWLLEPLLSLKGRL